MIRKENASSSRVRETDRPHLLCVGLIRASLENAREALQLQLEKTIRPEWVRSEFVVIDWRKFYEREGKLYDMGLVQIALFSPRENLTVYACNLADGWVSLYGNFIAARAWEAYFFRASISDATDYGVFEMLAWDHGFLKREVRVLQDADGWKFLNKGSPLPFESPMQYQKRQIKSRLDQRLIGVYSRAVGYDIEAVTAFHRQSWRFWRTD